MMMHNKWKRK